MLPKIYFIIFFLIFKGFQITIANFRFGIKIMFDLKKILHILQCNLETSLLQKISHAEQRIHLSNS